MQLSAYSLHLFTLPISGPKKSQEFLLKGFFFHQLSPDSSQDGHLSIQREKRAGHGVFLCSAVPQSMARALSEGVPSFCFDLGHCVRAAARLLLCVFPCDTVTYIPVLAGNGSYPGLSDPPFSRGILIIWWFPPTSPQIKCGAVLHPCMCVFE